MPIEQDWSSQKPFSWSADKLTLLIKIVCMVFSIDLNGRWFSWFAEQKQAMVSMKEKLRDELMQEIEAQMAEKFKKQLEEERYLKEVL